MHVISLGWRFTKETIRNIISCLPRARVSLSLIVCTECNQHFGFLAFILEKTHCCFLLSRVKVEVVVCTYCNQHRVVLAFISETILCFFVVSNQGAVCCTYPLQSTPGPPCRVSIFNLLSLNCTAYCKEHNRTHRTILQRTHQNTQNHIVRTHQNTKHNRTQRTPLLTAAPPWCHRSIMPNVRVGLFQLLDAGPSPAMAGRDIGWAAFDQRQGQIQPIPDGVHTHPV